MGRYCTNCGQQLAPDARFCGWCGNPGTVAPQATPDEDQADTPTVMRSSVFGEAVPVPPAWDRPGVEPQPTIAGAAWRTGGPAASSDAGGDTLAAPLPHPPRTPSATSKTGWLTAVSISSLALLPAVFVGLLWGILFVLRTGASPQAALGGIGAAASLTFGGRVGVGVDVPGSDASGGHIGLVGFPLGITVACGVILHILVRRWLKANSAPEAPPGLTTVLPIVACFVALTGVLTLFASFLRYDRPDDIVSITMEGSLAPALVGALVVSVIAAAMGIALHRRGDRSRWDRWRGLMSAPLYGVTVLLTGVSTIALLSGLAALIAGGSSLAALSSYFAVGLLCLPNLGLLTLSGGVLATGQLEGPDTWITDIGGHIGGNLGSTGLAHSITSAPSAGPWVWLVPLLVSMFGVLSAVTAILRRRDRLVRDGIVWVASLFAVALVCVLLLPVAASWTPGDALPRWLFGELGALAFTPYTNLTPLLTADGLSFSLSATLVLLLPAFAGAWWVLGALVAPRLPSGLIRKTDRANNMEPI